ncbi:MAG: hypothetical protein FJ027_24320 [Candidatus Rokubacteria bacterium]|nr:hypothetical protein [Candidatus Rokubacteria bacterium]
MNTRTFRLGGAVAVLAVVLGALAAGLSTEQIAAAVGLMAVALGELGLRQPTPGGDK